MNNNIFGQPSNRPKRRKGPIEYLLELLDWMGRERANKPFILDGDAERIKRLIAYCRLNNPFISGVLSFTDPWARVSRVIEFICLSFEEIAFPGVRRRKVVRLWVAHLKGEDPFHDLIEVIRLLVEVHYVAILIDLSNGMRLQPYFHGSKEDREIFVKWRQLVNLRCGFCDPCDRPPQDLRPIRNWPASKAAVREEIYNLLLKKIAAGLVKNAGDVRRFLVAGGVKILGELTQLDRHKVRVRVPVGVFGVKKKAVELPLEGAIFLPDFHAEYDSSGGRVRRPIAPLDRSAKNEALLVARIQELHRVRVDLQMRRSAARRRPRKKGREGKPDEFKLGRDIASLKRLSPYEADNILRTAPKAKHEPAKAFYELRYLKDIGKSAGTTSREAIRRAPRPIREEDPSTGVSDKIISAFSRLVDDLDPDCFTASECSSDLVAGLDRAIERIGRASVVIGQTRTRLEEWCEMRGMPRNYEELIGAIENIVNFRELDERALAWFVDVGSEEMSLAPRVSTWLKLRDESSDVNATMEAARRMMRDSDEPERYRNIYEN